MDDVADGKSPSVGYFWWGWADRDGWLWDFSAVVWPVDPLLQINREETKLVGGPE